MLPGDVTNASVTSPVSVAGSLVADGVINNVTELINVVSSLTVANRYLGHCELDVHYCRFSVLSDIDVLHQVVWLTLIR